VVSRRRFDGRGVIVTGAASGIGRAIASAFEEEGATVVAVDVREADGLRTIVADLGDAVAAGTVIPAAVELLGRVHVLVNCAGIQPDGPALDVAVAEFDRTLAVNTRGPFLLMQHSIRHFLAVGGPDPDGDGLGGAIVNVASTNAIRNESPESVYNASKAALVALTTAFAHEFGHAGIRVNCVAPGETLTPDERAANTAEDRAALRSYLERVPMRRPGRPEEQAAAVLFLASDDASFITGHTLVVDGGELSGDWFDRRDAPGVPEADR
jgi:NAD(P)-dependent dehydrogenase (short-subunit alcohol dehydrogenase family)